jgi:ABC-type uncharacterized transport system permease subunit
MVEGVFETLNVLPVKYKAQYWMAGMLRFPREVLRLIIQLLLAVILFKMQVSLPLLTIVIPLIIFSIPAFLSIGYLFISIFILTGRGSAISGLINTLFAFAAGAYFPLSLFPSWVEAVGNRISPFTLLLEQARLAMANQVGTNMLNITVNILILNVLYVFVGYMMLQFSLKKWRKNGNSWTSIG